MASGRKLTERELQNRLADLEARGITMLSQYTCAKDKGLFRCQYGHEWHGQIHSVFTVNGCRKCGRKKVGEKMRLPEKELQARCVKLAERGIVMVGKYISYHTKVLFRCANSHEWESTPARIFAGVGCPRCQDIETSTLYRLSESEVHLRLSKAAERGITIIGEYVDLRTRSRFRHTCGHEWTTSPQKIFRGSGCPYCADYGFQPDKPAILYYVRVRSPFGDPMYKIGVTNRTVRERFLSDFRKIRIIETWRFQTGAEAYEMEQHVLKNYDPDRYVGPNILKNGNDELFRCDVLGLDQGDRQLVLA